MEVTLQPITEEDRQEDPSSIETGSTPPSRYTRISVNIPRTPDDLERFQVFQGSSLQAAVLRRPIHAVTFPECQQEEGRETFFCSLLTNNYLTGRVKNQDPDNWIDYLHPMVRRRRILNRQQYYVLSNDSFYHLPTCTEDIQPNRHLIPHPEEKAPFPIIKTEIPFLWKMKENLHFTQVQHPRNFVDYHHVNIKMNQEGEFYQTFSDDIKMYVNRLPHPEEQTEFPSTGIITRSMPGKLNWQQEGRLLQQHPENGIDYGHPIVKKKIVDSMEMYYIHPNVGYMHKSTTSWGSSSRHIQIPRPEQRYKGRRNAWDNQIPKLWKQVYFHHLDFCINHHNIQNENNTIDYLDPKVRLTSCGQFYEAGYARMSNFYFKEIPAPSEDPVEFKGDRNVHMPDDVNDSCTLM